MKSQRERDTEAIGLAQRKGVMLAQLAELAADERLDPASMPIVEWFREEVKEASGGGRLEELAALLPDSGIQRRRRWQGSPAAIESGYDEYDDEYDDDKQPVPAAARAGTGYAAELTARSWTLQPHGPGVCHVVARGWDGSPDPCARRAGRVIPGGAICDHHHQALITPLSRRPA